MNERGICVPRAGTIGTTATNPQKRTKKNGAKNGKKNGKRSGAAGILVPHTLPPGTTANSSLR
jgi:hypothetical protein